MFIEADDILVRRSGRLVLSEVSVGVREGECISLIGPNGAGKSTLMSALLGLLPLERGTVRLAGRPLSTLSRKEIARQVAYVPQVHEGYLGYDVQDVVEAGRYPHVAPLEPLSEGDQFAVAEAVEACRIGDLLDRRVETLSGGERQKVWLAAALAQATPALFLDEPTTALDPAHQAELIRVMRRLAESGRTLLVICHDLNLPLALGGRVLAIRDHRIALDADVEALLDTGVLATLFGTEFALHQATEGSARSIQLRV